MSDVRVVRLAAKQFNRFSRRQLLELGLSDRAIQHRLVERDWVSVHEGVFAIAPALPDPWATWMAATLTEPGSVLSHASAGAAWGWWERPRLFEIVTRPGSGGPVRHGEVLAHRSERLHEDTTTVRGVPVTRVPRTLLDLAPHIGDRLLARCVREAVRLGTTSPSEIIEALTTRHRGRRGTRRLALTVAKFAQLPVHRARSGTEVIALQVLRAAGRPMPQLNVRIAGEEADLSWRRERLIIEIDGGP